MARTLLCAGKLDCSRSFRLLEDRHVFIVVFTAIRAG